MTTILEALRYDMGVRLSNGDTWLIVEERTGEFVVYERKAYQKKTREVYRGDDEGEAVDALIGKVSSRHIKQANEVVRPAGCNCASYVFDGVHNENCNILRLEQLPQP